LRAQLYFIFLTGSALEKVLILYYMRTEDEMIEMAGNLLIRENLGYRHRGNSHATTQSQASDQIA